MGIKSIFELCLKYDVELRASNDIITGDKVFKFKFRKYGKASAAYEKRIPHLDLLRLDKFTIIEDYIIEEIESCIKKHWVD